MPTETPVEFRPCRVCRQRRTPWGGECKSCRVTTRRLYATRRAEACDESDEYRAVKAVRVERYASIIAAGGRLFEGAA